MKSYKINKLLLFTFLRLWNKDYKFESFITIFSFFISSISIAVSIIIVSINLGFEENILNSIENISGNTRIYSNDNSYLDNDDFNSLNLDDISLSRIVEEKAVVKYLGNTELALLILLDNEEPRIKEMNEFIIEGYYTDSTLVLGSLLYEKLNINIGDYLYVIKINNSSDTYQTYKSKVSGVFSTDFLDVDSHYIYGSIPNDINEYDYFISDLSINSFDSEFLNDYSLYSYEQTYGNFISWLDSYDNPLKILIFFIFIISSINILHNNYYLLFNKSKQINILKILGLSYENLKLVFFIRSVILALSTSLFGALIAYSVLYLESIYKFIDIPEYVYYTNKLPIKLNLEIFYIIIPYLILISIISLLLNYKKQFGLNG
tara:strand:+ start:30 stop:1157 length:1128 start_codon:yes stop_codon:yes gene_type:complete